MTAERPRKDRQTVQPDGTAIAPRIAGVVTRPAVTIEDDRGSICEIFSPAWGIHNAPLVYAYQTTVRPRRIKGWVMHVAQDDRLFFSHGAVKVVLYDDRPDSPTYRMLNELYFSDHNRGLLVIPHHVWHAVENIGETDAVFTNLPTQPYNHADPDKFRLPLDTDAIPYRFIDRRGGYG